MDSCIIYVAIILVSAICTTVTHGQRQRRYLVNSDGSISRIANDGYRDGKRFLVGGKWNDWSRWSVCSQTCNGGFRERTRVCEYNITAPHGFSCVGTNHNLEVCNQAVCPVDGSLSQWTSWTSCTATCGSGSHTRSRQCRYPAGVPHGADCVGPLTESRSCTTTPCTVDGVWGAWGSWSACSHSCAVGFRESTRTCGYNSTVSRGGGCAGDDFKVELCNEGVCPVDGTLSQWNNWTTCTVSCGTGSQTRSRQCQYPSGVPHGADCASPLTDSQSCNTNTCPVDDTWSDWGSWSACSHTCDVGFRERTRTCAPHGFNCAGRNHAVELCNEGGCPVDGVLTAWSQWAQCSHSCGGGIQSHSRTCRFALGAPHGHNCSGNMSEVRDCGSTPCPVDGTWSSWTRYSRCDVTCGGGGTMIRTRTCRFHPAAPHGLNCTGRDTMTRNCQKNKCPVDGTFDEWTTWSTCTKKCDNGTQHRTRNCVFPDGVVHGHDCVGAIREQQSCHENPCHTTTTTTTTTTEAPVDGVLSNWSNWTDCTVSCGGGTQHRNRQCLYRSGKPHGHDCGHSLNNTQTCNTELCPVDGNWTAWVAWTRCDVTCGNGTRTRSRHCEFDHHAPHGNNCTGTAGESRACSQGLCPVDGIWSGWEAWSACTVSCGGSVQVRVRTCDYQVGIPHGKRCEGETHQNQTCAGNTCPVDGKLTKWTDWSTCTKSCEGGTTSRSRTCQYDPHSPHRKPCIGLLTDHKACHVHLCPVAGHWSNWTITPCTVSCGGGTQQRTRTCIWHNPNPHGSICYGPNNGTDTCNTDHCPVAGKWSDWGSWSSCSHTCNVGIRSSTRTCEYNGTAPHGHRCTGTDHQAEICPVPPCPADGVWAAWMPWGECSVTCGNNGTVQRSRNCAFSPPSAPHGKNCSGLAVQTMSCYAANITIKKCPVDGVWTAWNTWSTCPASCGAGTISRSRTCVFAGTPHGKDCVGSATETNTCTPADSCPADGAWGSWKSWGSCPVTCGGGVRRRRRNCEYPPHRHQGSYCVGKGRDTEPCSTNSCPAAVTTTVPPTPRTCDLCYDEAPCQIVGRPETCPIEKQYCINKIINEAGGNQQVERRCGTYGECVSGWWKTYSVIDKCTRFKAESIYTLSFTCEFCCTTDNCNAKLHPVDLFVN